MRSGLIRLPQIKEQKLISGKDITLKVALGDLGKLLRFVFEKNAIFCLLYVGNIAEITENIVNFVILYAFPYEETKEMRSVLLRKKLPFSIDILTQRFLLFASKETVNVIFYGFFKFLSDHILICCQILQYIFLILLRKSIIFL